MLHVPSCPLPRLFAKGPFCQIDTTLHLFEEINHYAVIFSHEGFLNKWRKSRVGRLACGECIHPLRDPCIFWCLERTISQFTYINLWDDQINDCFPPKSSYPSLWYDVDTCSQRIGWASPDSESRYMYAPAQVMCCLIHEYERTRLNNSIPDFHLDTQ